MFLLYVTLMICIIYLLSKKHDDNYIIQKGVLDPELCNNIIKISDKYSFEDYTEEVDDKPAYEIDIYDSEAPGNHILNEELWSISKNIYEVHLKRKYPKPPEYVFLRRYTCGERVDLPIHFDENEMTTSFLLSKQNEVEGGELYIFNREMTNKYRYINYKPPHIKNEFIRNFKGLPVIEYDQGDMLSYKGKRHLHGVLPVTKGVRYTISFFFGCDG